MKYDKSYFSEMLGKFGIEETLNNINIEDIDDPTVKIVCRTIKHSQDTLREILQITEETPSQQQVS